MSRFEKVAAKLKEYGLDAMLITSSPNRRYVTEFASSSGVALVTPNGSWFFTDSRYIEAARLVIRDAEVRESSGKALLGELAAEDAGRLALKLREVRQKRREAKDLLDQAGPVADWLESRRAVVKELEQLLGGVRKAERRSRDRIYTPKTNILEEDGTWNG